MSENPTPLYVVCSPRTRVGKTLVSRLLAEFYLVDYRHVVAFDLADEGPQLVDYLPDSILRGGAQPLYRTLDSLRSRSARRELSRDLRDASGSVLRGGVSPGSAQ